MYCISWIRCIIYNILKTKLLNRGGSGYPPIILRKCEIHVGKITRTWEIISRFSMQKIYSLQYLRAFAAIWVLLTHVLQLCDVRPNDVFWAGQWGVDIFFLLSGFIIYLTTKEESSWIDFGIKRIFRIYPAYLLILTFYLLYKTSFSLNMNELIGGVI